LLSSDSHSPSLRAYLYLGLGSVSLAFLVVAIWMVRDLGSRVEEQADAQVRALSRNRAQQALLVALLEEEAGLRGFLATGDARYLDSYQQGLRGEQEALRTTQDNLTEEDEAVAKIPLQRIQASVELWHQRTTPLIAARGKGPMRDLYAALQTEKRQFEVIRGQSEDLARLMDDRDNTRLTLLESALSGARWIAFGAIGIVLLVGFAVARWIVRHVVEPLVELSEFAREGDGFPEPSGASSVREVGILSRALHELDLRGREREQALREDHEDALHIQEYMTLLQQFSQEEDVISAFDQALRRLLRPDALKILLHAADSNYLEFSGPGSQIPEKEPSRILSEPMACRAIRQGSSVRLGALDPLACICPLGVPGRGSYLCIPLLASGQMLGLINLQSRGAEHWTASRTRKAMLLATSTAAALQLIRALETARERAVRDGLTGIHNRRFLDEVLQKLVDQARRKSHKLSALMLDIDHFKRFNDQFGHEVGDRVLVATAQCIERGLRAGDLLARYGGEEFAVLLPETEYADALIMAERLRASLDALVLPEPEFPAGSHVTLSIGAAALPDHALDADGLLSQADKALYEAKGCGRNCVVGVEELGKRLG